MNKKPKTPLEGAFACDGYPCPDCGHESILGFQYLNQHGLHAHTHYVCTFWGSPEDKSVYRTKGYDARVTRCGWHGWTIPPRRRKPKELPTTPGSSIEASWGGNLVMIFFLDEDGEWMNIYHTKVNKRDLTVLRVLHDQGRAKR